MRLLLVRHGETLNNLEKRFTGQTDVALNVLGFSQAKAVGERLSAESLDAIVSSNLERTRSTAQIIARHHALPVLEDPNLREIALGAWEGCTYAEVAALDTLRLKRWQTDFVNSSPPGGETAIQVRDRVLHALRYWQEQYPTGTVVWVTHAGVIQLLLCYLLGMDFNRRHQFHLENASITELILGQTYAIVKRLNEMPHSH